MLTVGEINVYVSDFDRALGFWADGLGLTVAEKEVWPQNAHARLEFPDASPSIRLIWPAQAWFPDERPLYGTRPMVAFDVATDDFDAVLARLLENEGTLIGEVQTFEDLRNAQIADPDGNVLELVEIPKPHH